MSGQLWATSSLGGFLYSDELSDVLREAVQPLVKFRQLADAKDFTDKGLNRGEAFHWDVVSDIASRGGTLVETSTMPESNLTITQGTGTVTERGIAVPYTGKLEALAKHTVRDPLIRALKNDAKKSLDAMAFDQFNATPLRVVASSGTDTSAITLTTNGTATSTNNVAMGKEHVKNIVDTMKERNIPPFMGDDYIAVSHPTSFRQLKSDLESVHQYVDRGFQMILNGEIGRYEGVRFIEQTNIPKGGAADSTTFNSLNGTADAWDNAKSSWVFFCGEDTAAEAICIPEEVRAKIPSDYGRSRGIAWYYLGGAALVHTTAAQARIVKWDSAA